MFSKGNQPKSKEGRAQELRSVPLRLYVGDSPRDEIDSVRDLLRNFDVLEIQREGFYRPVLMVGQQEVGGYTGLEEIKSFVEGSA